MYQDSVCFDPNISQEEPPENGFFQTQPNITTTSFSLEELSVQEEPNAAMEIELQQQHGMDVENFYGDNHHSNLMDNITHLIPYHDHNSSWDINNADMKIIQEDHSQVNEMQNSHHLLNLIHPTKVSPSSVIPNSSFPFGFLGDYFPSAGGGGSASNDPLFHLNLAPQPPYFRDLFDQSLPCAYNLPGSRTGSVKVRNGRKNATQFPTERDRREHLNGRFTALKGLIPNSTKSDRASILAEAIEYIKEQLRRVNELKILVEKKQYGRERIKRHKTEDGTTSTTTAAGEVLPEDSTKMIIKPDPDHHFYSNGSSTLRSSWLQRKSMDTEVDVRIVDDEVTIKLAQRKRINCLLVVSKLLDELQLDIQHVAGGLVGDNYSFLLNCKIGEGSFVYASAIANKLIDVVNSQYAAKPPTHPH